MNAPAPLEPDVLAFLRELEIHDPDPNDPLHLRIVGSLRRTRGMERGERLAALQWVFIAFAEEISDEAADAESEFPKVVALRKIELGEAAHEARAKHQQLRNAEIVKARDAGEKNAEVAAMRADLVREVREAGREATAAELRAKEVEADDQVIDARRRWKILDAQAGIARSKMWSIKEEIKVWSSLNANRRAADQLHARQGV
ncbi:hypothetical protein Q9R08_05030 [Microbacterium sp. QXD-8]|uniref:Uncharacterized protein n=1 Tax=Microbacterium psychrotolerans TaxID=3068321 RepID=A0ABU0Z1C3_9MICO|nr:hypothetical protein [Microbacterium sp. QXD-8]MDQ7877336.1 hypothetical protein [Microbacterium sp. QXD-8]